MVIQYNIETDNVIDVLNDSNMKGLGYASYFEGKVVIYTTDEWNEFSKNRVAHICKDFGEEYLID